MALKVHPDKGASAAQFREVKEAAEWLRNFLLRGGDIEKNPGPAPRFKMMPQTPLPVFPSINGESETYKSVCVLTGKDTLNELPPSDTASGQFVSVFAIWEMLLLLLAGDVEMNPGPTTLEMYNSAKKMATEDEFLGADQVERILKTM